MALNKETARKIIEVVAKDADCRNAIQPSPFWDSVAKITNPGTDLLLRFSHTAGSVRNSAYILKNIVLNKKPEEDEEMTARMCIGIASATARAIIYALRQKSLPEVRASSSLHRVCHGIHHDATWIRTNDDSEYVFDWHATLKIQDPVISKAEDWMQARNGINYVLFKEFK